MIKVKHLKRKNPKDKELLSKLIVKKAFPPYGVKYEVYLDNKRICYADIDRGDKNITYVQTNHACQHKGVASYLYDYIEKDLGRKLEPSEALLEDGEAFWNFRSKKIQNPKSTTNKSNTIIIYGENHSDKKEIRKINKQIRLRKPDFILHELLYEDRVLNKKQALNRLNNCKEGSVCDPRLNKDLYQLAFDLEIPIIGIDLKIKNNNLSLKDKFKLREHHMMEMIYKYHRKGNIIVIVGDTHLRTIKTKILGEPFLHNIFKNKAEIIRSSSPEIK